MATAQTGLPEHHVAHHFDSPDQEFDSIKNGGGHIKNDGARPTVALPKGVVTS